MAIPSLAAMAALTLFHNPHMQPEGVSVDYAATGDSWSTPATAIQRFWRRRAVLNRAATRINALLRAFRERCHINGIFPQDLLLRPDRYSLPWNNLGLSSLRTSRHYLGLHRVAFRLGPVNPNLRRFRNDVD